MRMERKWLIWNRQDVNDITIYVYLSLINARFTNWISNRFFRLNASLIVAFRFVYIQSVASGLDEGAKIAK